MVIARKARCKNFEFPSSTCINALKRIKSAQELRTLKGTLTARHRGCHVSEDQPVNADLYSIAPKHARACNM